MSIDQPSGDEYKMTALALVYFYVMATLGIIGIPFVVNKEVTHTAEKASVVLGTNLLESVLVVFLWNDSEFAYRTPVAIVLLAANLYFIIRAIKKIGVKRRFTANAAVFSLLVSIATVTLVSFLAFG